MSLALRIACCVLALLGTFPALAREPAERLLDDQRQDEERARLERDALPSADARPPALNVRPEAVDEDVIVIERPSIQIDSAGLLSALAQASLIDEFSAVPLGVRRIGLLLRRLDARLIEAGWITSRSRLVSLEPARNLIRIEVVPGRVEAIRSPDVAPGAVARAFPLAAGDLLTQEALEQGVQQINRLRMMQAQVRVLPGTQEGGSVIDLALQPARSTALSIGVDNLGTRSTGMGRARIGLRLGNRLGLFEDLQLVFLRSAHSEALLASLSVPDGFNTWSATLSGSRSDSTFAGLSFDSSARTAVIGWNRVLALDAVRRDALDLSVQRTRIARTLGPVELDTRRSTVARLAWSRTGRVGQAQYFVEPSLSFGLRSFGAEADARRLPDSHTHYQFTKWSLAAGAVARDDAGRFEFASQLTVQRTGVSLPGAEQLLLGGLNTVRGFDEASVAGDTGYLLRCEVRFPRMFGRAPHASTPFLHVDQGATRLIDGPRMKLTGAGAGVRGNTPDFAWEAVISTPLRRPEGLPVSSWTIRFALAYAI
jgi:hemolysin activation/secretion protein